MGELGSLLTRAREARGLTLEDAERDTRISRRYLQALEAEQFEVIPAPVYARGFLRSYAQYLGLDPQEALAMFPREDEPEYQRAAEAHSPPQRASKETPISPVSAARPAWRTPPPEPEPVRPERAERPERREPEPPPQKQRQKPERTTPRPGLGRKPAPEPDPSWEPVIGVDIGVPNPARKIKTDPAAQTRSVVVAIIAVGVILGAVLVAIIISNLGGAAETPPGTGPDATEAAGGTGATATSSAAAVSGTPGLVPTVLGLQEEQARQALTTAGYTVRDLRIKNAATKGEVIEQTPIPGTELRAGSRVDIVISEGP